MLGLRPAVRGRSRLLLGALWFFSRSGSGSAAGVRKVGPWWGRGWEDGVARLGAERLGLWAGVGSAGGRPQLRGAPRGPGPAATARTQVKIFFPASFSSVPQFRPSILGGASSGAVGLPSLTPPSALLSSLASVQSSLLPAPPWPSSA